MTPMLWPYLAMACVLAVISLERAEALNMWYSHSPRISELAGKCVIPLRVTIQVLSWLTILAWCVQQRLTH